MVLVQLSNFVTRGMHVSFVICSTTQSAAHVFVDIENKSTGLEKHLTFFRRGSEGGGVNGLPEFLKNIANLVLVCHKIFYG